MKSLVVDAGIWLPGKRSLVAPRDVEGMDWIERAVELRAERGGPAPAREELRP